MLPFGLSTAPKVFTRVVRVKVQGVNMHQYLDWLLKKQLRALIDRQRNLTLFWVNKLGFLMNKGKSQLVPTHHPAFLGSTLDLLRMVVFPSERRVVNVSRLVATFLTRGPQLAITWQKFLGHLATGCSPESG